MGDIPLQAFDVVYVPESWIANANLFVDEYIQGLLMSSHVQRLGF